MHLAHLATLGAADVLLSIMARTGQIERVRRGAYGLPGTNAKIAKKLRSKGKPQRYQRDVINSNDLSDLDRTSSCEVSEALDHHYFIVEQCVAVVAAPEYAVHIDRARRRRTGISDDARTIAGAAMVTATPALRPLMNPRRDGT